MQIAADSTYFPGPMLELARGALFRQESYSRGTPDQVWLFDQAQKPVLLREGLGDQSRVVMLSTTDPWLLATWQKIASHRNLQSGWDGENAPTPSRECLDAAEALAVLMSAKPMGGRPQFAVDSQGRPSFATYADNLYLHLTIEARDRLSWYAVAHGQESFHDDVPFDGVILPTDLGRLF